MVRAARFRHVRYFTVLGLHPTYTLVVLSAIAALGVVTVWLDAAELDSGLGMILFAQMFVASTGFLVRARQGHFDPLLTGSAGRAAVAAAHGVVSMAPGVVAWLVVASAGWFAGSPGAVSAVAGGRAAGLFVVSAVAWAVGFGLPRGAAGMLWMALLIVLVTQRTELLAAAAREPSIAATLRDAAVVTVCPFLVLGNAQRLAAGAVPAALVLPALMLVAVLRRCRTLDLYLVDQS